MCLLCPSFQAVYLPDFGLLLTLFHCLWQLMQSHTIWTLSTLMLWTLPEHFEALNWALLCSVIFSSVRPDIVNIVVVVWHALRSLYLAFMQNLVSVLIIWLLVYWQFILLFTQQNCSIQWHWLGGNSVFTRNIPNISRRRNVFRQPQTKYDKYSVLTYSTLESCHC